MVAIANEFMVLIRASGPPIRRIILKIAHHRAQKSSSGFLQLNSVLTPFAACTVGLHRSGRAMSPML